MFNISLTLEPDMAYGEEILFVYVYDVSTCMSFRTFVIFSTQMALIIINILFFQIVAMALYE